MTGTLSGVTGTPEHAEPVAPKHSDPFLSFRTPKRAPGPEISTWATPAASMSTTTGEAMTAVGSAIYRDEDFLIPSGILSRRSHTMQTAPRSPTEPVQSRGAVASTSASVPLPRRTFKEIVWEIRRKVSVAIAMKAAGAAVQSSGTELASSVVYSYCFVSFAMAVSGLPVAAAFNMYTEVREIPMDVALAMQVVVKCLSVFTAVFVGAFGNSCGTKRMLVIIGLLVSAAASYTFCSPPEATALSGLQGAADVARHLEQAPPECDHVGDDCKAIEACVRDLIGQGLLDPWDVAQPASAPAQKEEGAHGPLLLEDTGAVTGALLLWFAATYFLRAAIADPLIQTPYESIGLSLTSDHEQRARLFATKAASKYGGLMSSMVLAIVASLVYASSLAKQVQTFASINALVMSVAALGMWHYIRDPEPVVLEAKGSLPNMGSEDLPNMGSGEPRALLSVEPVVPILVRIFASRPFMWLLCTRMIVNVGMLMMISNFFYATKYVLRAENAVTFSCLSNLFSLIFAFVGIAIAVPLARTNGKREVMACALLLLATFLLCMYCVPPSVFIERPMSWALLMALPAVGFSLTNVCGQGLLAGCIDYDELRTGRRHESHHVMLDKTFETISNTMAAGLAGLLLGAAGYQPNGGCSCGCGTKCERDFERWSCPGDIGYACSADLDSANAPFWGDPDRHAPCTEEPEGVVTTLRVLFYGIPGICMLLGAYCTLNVPLDSATHGALLTQMRRRQRGRTCFDPLDGNLELPLPPDDPVALLAAHFSSREIYLAERYGAPESDGPELHRSSTPELHRSSTSTPVRKAPTLAVPPLLLSLSLSGLAVVATLGVVARKTLASMQRHSVLLRPPGSTLLLLQPLLWLLLWTGVLFVIGVHVCRDEFRNITRDALIVTPPATLIVLLMGWEGARLHRAWCYRHLLSGVFRAHDDACHVNTNRRAKHEQRWSHSTPSMRLTRTKTSSSSFAPRVASRKNMDWSKSAKNLELALRRESAVELPALQGQVERSVPRNGLMPASRDPDELEVNARQATDREFNSLGAGALGSLTASDLGLSQLANNSHPKFSPEPGIRVELPPLQLVKPSEKTEIELLTNRALLTSRVGKAVDEMVQLTDRLLRGSSGHLPTVVRGESDQLEWSEASTQPTPLGHVLGHARPLPLPPRMLHKMHATLTYGRLLDEGAVRRGRERRPSQEDASDLFTASDQPLSGLSGVSSTPMPESMPLREDNLESNLKETELELRVEASDTDWDSNSDDEEDTVAKENELLIAEMAGFERLSTYASSVLNLNTEEIAEARSALIEHVFAMRWLTRHRMLQRQRMKMMV
jgi:Na+/melibiose symporter-like transporter